MRLQRVVEFFDQALALAVDDAVLQPAFDGLGARLLRGVGDLFAGEQLQQLFQRVVTFGAAVKDQVFGDFHFLWRQQMQRTDLRDMDDRSGHAGARRVVEEYRIQYRPRRRVQPEADIRQAQNDLHAGKFGADRGDALQRPLRQFAVVLVAGGDGEGQRIDQQIGLREAMLVTGEINQSSRDAQLVL